MNLFNVFYSFPPCGGDCHAHYVSFAMINNENCLGTTTTAIQKYIGN